MERKDLRRGLRDVSLRHKEQVDIMRLLDNGPLPELLGLGRGVHDPVGVVPFSQAACGWRLDEAERQGEHDPRWQGCQQEEFSFLPSGKNILLCVLLTISPLADSPVRNLNCTIHSRPCAGLHRSEVLWELSRQVRQL